MRYLLLMDELRQNAPWIAVVVLALISALMIWSPTLSMGWTRRMVRVLGGVVLGITTMAAVLLGFFASLDPPRVHFVAVSPDGLRFALLSHSELHDGAATEIAVAPRGFCTRFIAYRYFGDGSDYVGQRSIKWIDDHHLKVEYVRDATGTQYCAAEVGDVVITCVSRPEPVFAQPNR